MSEAKRVPTARPTPRFVRNASVAVTLVARGETARVYPPTRTAQQLRTPCPDSGRPSGRHGGRPLRKRGRGRPPWRPAGVAREADAGADGTAGNPGGMGKNIVQTAETDEITTYPFTGTHSVARVSG